MARRREATIDVARQTIDRGCRGLSARQARALSWIAIELTIGAWNDDWRTGRAVVSRRRDHARLAIGRVGTGLAGSALASTTLRSS